MNRQYMVDYRAKHGIDISRMAKACHCSPRLLSMLESWDEEVTHPNIALRVAHTYRLAQEQYESLLPANYRPSSHEYNPGKYKLDVNFVDFYTERRVCRWQ